MKPIEAVVTWLREIIEAQPWLAPIHSYAERAPDWVLLTALGLLLLLLVVIFWPRKKRASEQNPHNRDQASRPPAKASAEAQSAPPTPPSSLAQATSGPAKPAPAAADEDDNRTVRVFVSSTFLDMQRERDVLVRQTFPALRAKFRARGVELLEVDLRWGITQEQSESGKTLPTLLAEIDRCRPYFIGLLGERYGWVPPAAALTDELKAAYPSIAGASSCSVTELEIIHGVLSDPQAAKRAIFFERDPAWLETLSAEERAVYVADNDHARAKLADLKTRIRISGAKVVPYAKPDDISSAVEAALVERIEEQFPGANAPDAFTQTARLHTAYARERRGLHIGAAPYMSALDTWITQADARPMLITGASGGGKSTLVANWVARHRAAAPLDIVFEHYLGASPDSADPIQLIRRLWEQLNRATAETVDTPSDEQALIDGLSQRLAQAHAFAERTGARVLIVLDGLDKFSSQQDLRWLPTYLPPRVRLLASSLDGDARAAAQRREWNTIELKPLTDFERREFIETSLRTWGRALSSARTERILASSLSGSPLFLKTLLDELRVAGIESELNARLDDYLAAHDIPELFARVLRRLEGDCGNDFVRAATSLIWASRAGLEEAEIVTITGATPLAWSILRNGLGDSLRDHEGRIAFSHDNLRRAVADRYLIDENGRRAIHLAIADRFVERDNNTRRAEELPYQLREATAWDRLEKFLVDLNNLAPLRARGDADMLSYWLSLREHDRDPEDLLCNALDALAPSHETWSPSELDLAFDLGEFFSFAGITGDRRVQMEKGRLTACERLFGTQHHMTARSLNNLAGLLRARGSYEEAEQAYRKASAIYKQLLGPDHPEVATALNNLGLLLTDTSRYAEAETIFREAIEIDEHCGGASVDLARDQNNLAVLLENTDRLDEAEALYRKATEIFERRKGSSSPDVATCLDNLGRLLQARGKLQDAEPFHRRAIAIYTEVLGPKHHDLAVALNNLSKVLQATDRFADAEEACRRALAIDEVALGEGHPSVAATLNELARLQGRLGRADEAQHHYLRAIEIYERTLGEHPHTAICLNNFAGLLKGAQKFEEAERAYLRAIDILRASAGPTHTLTATCLANLADLLSLTDRVAEAVSLLREAHSIFKARLGEDHPSTKTVAQDLRILTDRHMPS